MINKIVYGPASKIATHCFQSGDVLISFANVSTEHVFIDSSVSRFLVNCTSAQYVEEGVIFTESMAKGLVAFLQQNSVKQPVNLFINCDHGEIRSASCAKALKDFFDVPCFFIGNNVEIDPEVYCHRIYDYVLDALM